MAAGASRSLSLVRVRMPSLDLRIPPEMAEQLRACRRHFIFVAIFSAMVNLLYLAPTIYMMQVYDRAVPTQGRQTLLFLTLIVAFALIVLSALDGMRSRLLFLAGLRLERLLGRPILQRVVAAEAATGVPNPMRDFDTLRQFATGAVALALVDLPWTLIYLAVACIIHPALGGLIVVGGAILTTLAVANERATRSVLQMSAARQSHAYALQEAATRNAEPIRALGMRGAVLERQVRERAAGIDLTARAQMTGGMLASTTKFFRLFLQSAALGLGAWLAIERQISAGSIIAASILLSRALQPLEQIVSGWSAVVQSRAAWDRLKRLFNAAPTAVMSMNLPAPSGRLAIENVSLRAGDGLALRSVSLEVAPGEALAVVGPSGGGKTAFARLIAGAAEPSLGVVRRDGANVSDWDSDRLGIFTGYLPQNCGLMVGSIRDNIARFSDASDRAEVDGEVVQAAKAAGVHAMILRLPKGYDTVLGPGGLGVSAGQGQRIALARALYLRPTLLVLDEPNSALDAEGETALYGAMSAAKAWGAAVIIMTHRTGVLAHCDRVAVIQDGQLVRVGPTADFLQQRRAADATPNPAAAQSSLRSAASVVRTTSR